MNPRPIILTIAVVMGNATLTASAQDSPEMKRVAFSYAHEALSVRSIFSGRVGGTLPQKTTLYPRRQVLGLLLAARWMIPIPAAAQDSLRSYWVDALSAAGGVEALERAHPDFKKSLTRFPRNNISARQRHATRYLLFQFFRNAGFSGMLVSDYGHRTEEIVAPRVMDFMAELGDSERFRIGLHPSTGLRHLAARSAEKMKTSDLTRIIFQDSIGHQRITPFSAYLLLGAYLREYGLADRVQIQALPDSPQWVLHITFDQGKTQVIRLGDSSEAFDLAGVAVLKDLDTILLLRHPLFKIFKERYPKTTERFRGSFWEQKIVDRVVNEIIRVDFFAPLAQWLAPYFFSPSSRVLWSMSNQEREYLYRLKSQYARLKYEVWDDALVSEIAKDQHVSLHEWTNQSEKLRLALQRLVQEIRLNLQKAPPIMARLKNADKYSFVLRELDHKVSFLEEITREENVFRAWIQRKKRIQDGRFTNLGLSEKRGDSILRRAS